MKTVLFIIALAMTVTFTANASTGSPALPGHSRNIEMTASKSVAPMKTEKSKKPHVKKHKHKSGSKKNK